ncbi:MAG: hypothetical protein Kow0069_14860 [Promethearchaeota archaeon]
MVKPRVEREELADPSDSGELKEKAGKGLVLVTALAFGFGWQVRGSGTSDPAVPALLLTLLVLAHAPREKLHSRVGTYLLAGLVVLVVRVTRTGWGTFVGQAGIPGRWPGRLASHVEGYDVEVAWWQGYFWLAIVGASWFGPPAFLLGGYLLTPRDDRPNAKDAVVATLLYFVGFFSFLPVSRALIPFLSPEAYWDVYRAGLSTRNYESMVDNLTRCFSLLPPAIYFLATRGRKFFANSAVVTALFAFSISVADLWQVVGRNVPELGIPYWSLWEYFTGFLFGALYQAYLLRRGFYDGTGEVGGVKADGFNDAGNGRVGRAFGLLIFLLGHFAAFTWGLQESASGSVEISALSLGFSGDVAELAALVARVALVVTDLALYLAWARGWFRPALWVKISSAGWRARSLTLLALLLPAYYACYAVPWALSGRLFALDAGALASWLDTASFAACEAWAAAKCRQAWNWKKRAGSRVTGPG